MKFRRNYGILTVLAIVAMSVWLMAAVSPSPRHAQETILADPSIAPPTSDTLSAESVIPQDASMCSASDPGALFDLGAIGGGSESLVKRCDPSCPPNPNCCLCSGSNCFCICV